MNKKAILQLACFLLVSLMAFQVTADDLSEYLQNPEISTTSSETTASTDANTSSLNKDTAQLKNIIELVVAGIVAAALIIVVLVIFLGRWLAGKEKKLIKELRIEAEEDAELISSAAISVREQERTTNEITQTIRQQAQELNKTQEETNQYYLK